MPLTPCEAANQATSMSLGYTPLVISDGSQKLADGFKNVICIFVAKSSYKFSKAFH
jgi:hypothetical protein